ncbi:hypothetical protein JOM56_000819 [Amanita muscaria]
MVNHSNAFGNNSNLEGMAGNAFGADSVANHNSNNSTTNGDQNITINVISSDGDKPLTITGHGSGGSGGADTGEPVVIAGVGGGKRVFWQAGDGSIHTKGWYPDGTPWTGRLLVPGERVRKPTPLAALCWGGESGFKQICFYYVDRWDVLQGMRRSGGSWRVEMFRSARRRVSPQSTLVAKQTRGGEVRVKYTSMRGAKSAASIPKEIIREVVERVMAELLQVIKVLFTGRRTSVGKGKKLRDRLEWKN